MRNERRLRLGAVAPQQKPNFVRFSNITGDTPMKAQIPILIMFVGMFAMQAFALWHSELSPTGFGLCLFISIFMFLIGQLYESYNWEAEDAQ